jgi:hypothetical protein
MAEEDMPDVTEAAARVNGLNLRIENGQVVAGAIAPAGGAAPAGGPAPAGAGSAAPAVQVPPAALAGVHQAAAAAGAVVGGAPPVPGAAVPDPHAQVVENDLANTFNQATRGIMAYVANNNTANINGVTQHIADDGLRHVMTLKLNSLHAAMFGGGRGGGSAGAGPSGSGGGHGGRGGRGGQGGQGNQGGRAGQGGQGGRGWQGNGNGNSEACFNCGGMGHRWFQCPSPPAKRQRGDEQH